MGGVEEVTPPLVIELDGKTAGAGAAAAGLVTAGTLIAPFVVTTFWATAALVAALLLVLSPSCCGGGGGDGDDNCRPAPCSGCTASWRWVLQDWGNYKHVKHTV